jgi:hypothetical protein
MARLYHLPKFVPNHLSISVDGNKETGYNFTINQTIPRKEKRLLHFPESRDIMG